MQSAKTLFRSLRIIAHLITGAAIALGVAGGRKLGLQLRWVPDVVRWWHARLCRALGLRIEVRGALVPNALLVANHVSWLDIPVLGSRERIDFLAKTEVGDWPLIGWMARVAGTLFIARGGNQAGRLSSYIGARLRAGAQVTLFPEGTTTDGSRLRRFHPRLFAAAQRDGVLVQPVALRYGAGSSPDSIAPFIGDDALLPHLTRIIRHPDLRVQVRFLEPLDGSALLRRQISEYCQGAIAEALGLDDSHIRRTPAASVTAQVADPVLASLEEAA